MCADNLSDKSGPDYGFCMTPYRRYQRELSGSNPQTTGKGESKRNRGEMNAAKSCRVICLCLGGANRPESRPKTLPRNLPKHMA